MERSEARRPRRGSRPGAGLSGRAGRAVSPTGRSRREAPQPGTAREVQLDLQPHGVSRPDPVSTPSDFVSTVGRARPPLRKSLSQAADLYRISCPARIQFGDPNCTFAPDGWSSGFRVAHALIEGKSTNDEPHTHN